MGTLSGPNFRKLSLVLGENLRFRNAATSDAEFILSLRLDPKKNGYLSTTSADVATQERWLQNYAQDEGQLYFIIETLDGVPVGTVRFYDQRGFSFCWGSWILSDNAPHGAGRESMLMVYEIGRFFGFKGSHFDVRKGNDKVWGLHEAYGAKRCGETELDYLYTVDDIAIDRLLNTYKDRLPKGIRVSA